MNAARAGWRPLVATSCTLAIAVFGACGDEQPREPAHPVTASVHALQQAFTAGDAAAVCALTTRSAHWQAGEVGHKDPTTCEQDVRRVFTMIQQGGGWGQHEKPTVAAVQTAGSRARVTLDLEGRWRADVPFTKTAGSWKLDGFIGGRPAVLDQVEKRGVVGPFRAGGRPVAAVEGGARCPALGGGESAASAGGCILKVSRASAPIRMLTPFGDFKFGDCSVDYRIHVDGAGRTRTLGWTVEGGEASGCSDIGQCLTPTAEQKEGWRGRIRAEGGGFVHHMDACVRTCIGVFVGDLAMRLTPDGEGWKAEQEEDVGVGGFQIDAELAATGSGVRFESRG